MCLILSVFFFQAEDGIRDLVRSRGLGDVYKRQDPAGAGATVAQGAAEERPGTLRCRDGEARSLVDLRAAGDAGAAVRLPGQGHRGQAADHRLSLIHI